MAGGMGGSKGVRRAMNQMHSHQPEVAAAADVAFSSISADGAREGASNVKRRRVIGDGSDVTASNAASSFALSPGTSFSSSASSSSASYYSSGCSSPSLGSPDSPLPLSEETTFGSGHDHDGHDGDVLGKPKAVACAAAPLPVTSGAGAAAVADIGTIGDPGTAREPCTHPSSAAHAPCRAVVRARECLAVAADESSDAQAHDPHDPAAAAAESYSSTSSSPSSSSSVPVARAFGQVGGHPHLAAQHQDQQVSRPVGGARTQKSTRGRVRGGGRGDGGRWVGGRGGNFRAGASAEEAELGRRLCDAYGSLYRRQEESELQLTRMRLEFVHLRTELARLEADQQRNVNEPVAELVKLFSSFVGEVQENSDALDDDENLGSA